MDDNKRYYMGLPNSPQVATDPYPDKSSPWGEEKTPQQSSAFNNPSGAAYLQLKRQPNLTPEQAQFIQEYEKWLTNFGDK